MIAHGIVGLFVGPIILAVTWELMMAWIREERAEAASPAPAQGAEKSAWKSPQRLEFRPATKARCHVFAGQNRRAAKRQASIMLPLTYVNGSALPARNPDKGCRCERFEHVNGRTADIR